MFKLGYPFMIWVMVITIPLLILVYILYHFINKKQLKIFADEPLIDRIMPDFKARRKHIKFILFILALALLFFAAADPQIGSKLTKVKRKGAEVIVALDVSNSMLAEDVYPTRLKASKMALEKLIDRLNENPFGLIVFAGDAFVQLPITSDYVSAKMFLSSINTKLVPVQGTNIAAAIELAMKSYSSQDNKNNKVLIIISDGENHEPGAIEMASEASKKGIIIHTIGMGKPEGAPIPIINKFGRKDYKTDKDGNVIITKTNDALLEQIASSANGVYVRAENSTTILNEIVNRIEKLTSKETEANIYSDFDHQYQYPLILSFLFFMIGFFFVERKPTKSITAWLKKLNPGKMTVILLLLSLNLFAQNYKKETREGTNFYLKKKYKESEVAFRKAYKLNPNEFKTSLNLGDALYKQNKYQEAEKFFIEAETKSKNSEDKAKAYHNLGNSYLKSNKLDESIEAYKNALRKNPNDTQTKYNLSYALALKKQQQQQQQQQQQKNQNNQQQEQQQQQQNNNNKDQNKDKNTQQQQKISKEDAERMLQALQEDEQNRQDKIKKQMIEASKKQIEKDW